MPTHQLLDQQIATFAELLARARAPLFAGLGTDMAGCREVLALAAHAGAAVDHMHGAALSRYVGAMRSGRMYFTTPREAAARADVVLLVGQAGRDAASLFAAPPHLGPEVGRPRRVLAVSSDITQPTVALLSLAAALKGRGAPPAGVTVADLQGARFGVVVWSPGELDDVAIAAITEVAETLAATTRFTTLPRLPADNAGGFLQAVGWTTAYAPPLRFVSQAGRELAAFDAAAALAAGEADLLVWISAFRQQPPPAAHCPVVTLTPQPVAGATLSIVVGAPGIDHDADFHDPAQDVVRHVAATTPSARPDVAGVLGRVRASLRRAA